jgi:hypothetical protein
LLCLNLEQMKTIINNHYGTLATRLFHNPMYLSYKSYNNNDENRTLIVSSCPSVCQLRRYSYIQRLKNLGIDALSYLTRCIKVLNSRNGVGKMHCSALLGGNETEGANDKSEGEQILSWKLLQL